MPKFWIFNRTKEITIPELKVDVKNSEMGEKKENSQGKLNQNSPKVSDDSGPSTVEITTDVENYSEDKIECYYGVSLPSTITSEAKACVFVDKTRALATIKNFKGARFKSFKTFQEAKAFALAKPEDTDTSKASAVEKLLKMLINVKQVTPTTTIEIAKPEYPSLNRNAIKCLKVAIEEGDVEAFKRLVESNPKYLVTGVDTPVIMKEGYRYNALHIATKAKQPQFCKLILDYLNDIEFIKRLYPENDVRILEQRRSYLLDMYLNMPDKRLNETPLHFACKFGCLESVKILTSYSICDTKRINKYGLTAKNIICERCPDSEDLKEKINKCFEEKFYVPVLRAKDNSIQPVIGEPYSPERSKLINKDAFTCPCKPELTVMAIAGPMSPTEAKDFYKKWKSPHLQLSSLRKCELHNIRLSDVDKGLERIGRQLAHEMKTKWTEFWPTLNVWFDFSSTEGLAFLEQHLRNLTLKMQPSFNNKTQSESTDDNSKNKLLDSSISPTTAAINDFYDKLQSFHISRDNSSSVNALSSCNTEPVPLVSSLNSTPQDVLGASPICATKFVLPSSSERLDNGDKRSYLIPPRLIESVVNVMASIYNLDSSLTVEEKIHSLLSDEVLPEIMCLNGQTNISFLGKRISDAIKSHFQNHELIIILRHIKSYLNNSSLNLSSDEDDDTGRSKTNDAWQLIHRVLTNVILRLDEENSTNIVNSSRANTSKPINTHAEKKTSSKSKKSITHDESVSDLLENTATKLDFFDSDCTDDDDDDYEDGDSSSDSDSYTTIPDSSSDSSDDYEAVTPPEDVEVFIEGKNPSKVDVDIFRAIEFTPIDPVHYPYIMKWKHLISSKDKKVVESWPSPAVKKHRQNVSKISMEKFSFENLSKHSKTNSNDDKKNR